MKLKSFLLASAMLLSFGEVSHAAPQQLFGQAGWFLNTPNPSDATLTQTPGAASGNPGLTVIINKASQPFYMIQLVRDIPGIIPVGHIIRMHFLARSATSNTIRIAIEKAAAPYNAVAADTVSLTPDWRDYAIQGDTVDLTPPGINAHLQLGQQNGTVEFRDITVEDLGVDPAIVVAQEALAPAQIQARIEKYRKGNLTIRVIDASGRPVKNALVSIKQTRHAFLFGCNAFGYNPADTSAGQLAYRSEFAALFNYATLPFYWGAFEGKRGSPDYDRLQVMADWCLQNGITPKGHPLVWQQVWPRWAPADPDASIPLLHNRVQDVVSHYSKSIHYWDVVNESNSAASYAPANGESLWVKRDGPANVVETALDWARTAEQGSQETFIYNDFDTTSANIALLTQLQKYGKLPDAIGLQSHMHGGIWPPAQLWAVCQNFARFGKPIHFTETTVLSGPVQPSSSPPVYLPTTPDGEAAQAAYVTQFYTILFSHPSVRAITWWDFSDHNSWMNAASGLVRADMTPKPAYTQLLTLIHKTWWTNKTGRTDGQGSLKQRVFYGAYNLTVTDKRGHDIKQSVFFPEASGNLSVTFRLPLH